MILLRSVWWLIAVILALSWLLSPVILLRRFLVIELVTLYRTVTFLIPRPLTTMILLRRRLVIICPLPVPLPTMNDKIMSLATAICYVERWVFFPCPCLSHGERWEKSPPVFLMMVGHLHCTGVYFIKFPMMIHWKCFSHITKKVCSWQSIDCTCI